MNHGREIMCAFEFDFQTNLKRLLHQRQHLEVRRIDMLHEQFTAIDRIGEGDHPGGKDIAGPELPRFHDRVPANDVRYQAAHLLIISNIVARQFCIRFGQFGSAHSDIAIVELFRAQEFPGRRGSQLETLRRIDFVQLL